MTLIRLYKPYGVLSQFRDPDRPTLADYLDLPGVYPAGRLDRDSEGLLLLTDDGALQARIAEPRFKLPKTYWAQVEARPSADALARLRGELAAGVALRDGPSKIESLRAMTAPDLPDRDPPVTGHRDARSCWLEVVLTSGRNRQVRRTLAAVGLPVLRLHRAAIGAIDLSGLAPGQWAETPVPPDWHADRKKRGSRVSGRRRTSR